ncbi:MAG TPA: hypothetical protein PKD27_05140, partial [Tepidiformaceae bacterium]|nr:hypothetical protein [Tepidiformaceae bacterium]
MYEEILYEVDGPAAVITLNRPEALNAFTYRTLAEAKAYISELAASASPASLMRMKQQVYRHLNMDLGEAMRESQRLMDESLKQADFGEGVRS